MERRAHAVLLAWVSKKASRSTWTPWITPLQDDSPFADPYGGAEAPVCRRRPSNALPSGLNVIPGTVLSTGPVPRFLKGMNSHQGANPMSTGNLHHSMISENRCHDRATSAFLTTGGAEGVPAFAMRYRSHRDGAAMPVFITWLPGIGGPVSR